MIASVILSVPFGYAQDRLWEKIEAHSTRFLVAAYGRPPARVSHPLLRQAQDRPPKGGGSRHARFPPLSPACAGAGAGTGAGMTCNAPPCHPGSARLSTLFLNKSNVSRLHRNKSGRWIRSSKSWRLIKAGLSMALTISCNGPAFIH